MDIKSNKSYILKQLAEAKGAEIAHFSECSFNGYVVIDFMSFISQDEHLLQNDLDKIIHFSAKHKIWIIVGSHPFKKNKKNLTIVYG